MIIFDLVCECGCQFEGWFKDHDDFYNQKQDGQLTCPHCGGFGVRKILSPVAVHTGSAATTYQHNAPDNQEGPSTGEIAAAIQLLQQYVVKNFEDVGPDLAQKALKIHYGVEKARNIRGVATADEERLLAQEGIELLKIPMPTSEDKTN